MRPLPARLARRRALATMVALGCALTLLASWARERDGGRWHARDDWASLLPRARVGRLRVAMVVDARDCAASLAALELFARPELAGAIGGVTLLLRDSAPSLSRYADARLTAGVQVGVVAVPRRLRARVRALGRGPRLLLLDPAGRVVWASRIDPSAPEAPSFARALQQVADHYLATELATANTASYTSSRISPP